ncbi:hypothetical protein [Sphingomonas sp. 28-62-11]|uniref:hypothetical protein n=1 Tax=Sphingomonas sp. 28-62-11 TaxID=1970432 RepID=UPI000BC93162|nr:MAG: hypothetical protein B7Y49_02680 [Sphingomonas sp. 28-62-11]
MGRRGSHALAIFCLPLALAACAQANDADANLDSLDAELADGNSTGNLRDPALMSALQDQIMVDPALVGQANYDAIRPPAQPYSAQVPPDMTSAGRAPTDMSSSEALKSAPAPVRGQACTQCSAAREALTLGGLVERQANRGARACAGAISYSTRWAQRLPAAVPLYPDARVREAAGTEAGSCALRVVSFASAAPVQRVLDWYYTRVSKAGYSAEHQAEGDEHVLAGTQGNAAYAVFATARADGGTDVDLVANNGK